MGLVYPHTCPTDIVVKSSTDGALVTDGDDVEVGVAVGVFTLLGVGIDDG
jgi:hypothetical protein